MGFFGAMEGKIEQKTDRTLTYALLGAALVFIAVALLSKNKWVKASLLAWIILP